MNRGGYFHLRFSPSFLTKSGYFSGLTIMILDPVQQLMGTEDEVINTVFPVLQPLWYRQEGALEHLQRFGVEGILVLFIDVKLEHHAQP